MCQSLLVSCGKKKGKKDKKERKNDITESGGAGLSNPEPRQGNVGVRCGVRSTQPEQICTMVNSLECRVESVQECRKKKVAKLYEHCTSHGGRYHRYPSYVRLSNDFSLTGPVKRSVLGCEEIPVVAVEDECQEVPRRICEEVPKRACKQVVVPLVVCN